MTLFAPIGITRTNPGVRRTRQDARDSDEPKKAIIALINNAKQTKALDEARKGATQRALKAELQQLKMPELRKRAVAAGASSDAIEAARDDDEPKEAIIALVLAQSAQP